MTVEEIVDDFGARQPQRLSSCRPGRSRTIALVPGGASPSYAHGYYPRDNAFYKAWDRIARERDSFLAWMDEHVLRSGPEAFARHAKAA